MIYFYFFLTALVGACLGFFGGYFLGYEDGMDAERPRTEDSYYDGISG